MRITSPIRRVADIPGAFVSRYLRKLAERHGPDGVPAWAVRRRGASRNDRVRRVTELHPLLKGGEHVKSIGAWTAAAVQHSGHHEQTDVFLQAWVSARCDRGRVLVQLDGLIRAD